MYYNTNSISIENFKKDTSLINQTRKYLIPQFKSYGEGLIEEIRKHDIIGTFIQDFGVNVTPEARIIKPEVYFLFDVNGPSMYGRYVDVKKSKIQFMESLVYFRKKSYYTIDYPFDSNKDGHYHVVVLKLPVPEKMKLFLEGKYSEIYTPEEINNWIPKEYVEIEKGKEVLKKSNIFQVLTRDENYFEEFKEKVINELMVRDSSINPKGEYDFPPHLPNEVLRY